MYRKYKKVVDSTIIIIILYLIANKFHCIGLSQIINSKTNDIHFNIITICSIIGGFLFTGLSILISVSDKKIIKDYMKTDIIESIYSNVFAGILFNILSIFCSVLLILNISIRQDQDFKIWLVHAEILFLILGLWSFVLSVIDLKFIVDSIKGIDEKIPEEKINKLREKFNSDSKNK
ncbi:hypothetical protein [Sporanaerobacter sp. PP17-6a]|uniref:hypothetical protein n=1 Tax=Sporanaerobacter sp. PP17-6a TaxID=1891289 RepID=UPI0008A02BC4|nr:hypothetical protein [Sporanaerobacter sp. PP17-6a]SCL85262.1 hypothetical protein PP176A_0823 [Sporanaerobacter sp. PP17-6a]